MRQVLRCRTVLGYTQTCGETVRRRQYKANLMKAYGIIQKEYVEVPGDLLKNTKELKRYFDISYEYIKSLKPKATKKAVSTRKKK
jgi:hypothetical protein